MVEAFMGCAYEGERSSVGPADGKGTFTFKNKTRYVGEFLDGQFHGKGTLYFPNRGRYEAEWDHGKAVSGRLFFDDDLEFQNDNWEYCSATDRRYNVEIKEGLGPAGESYITPTKREPRA